MSTFPRSSVYDLADLLPSLGIGEAVVTVLSEPGATTPVAWTRLRPPTSLMAQLDPTEQARQVQASPLAQRYAAVVDRESAYEKLLAEVAAPPPRQSAAGQRPSGPPPSSPGPSSPASPSPPPSDDGPDLDDRIGSVLGSIAFKAFSRNVGGALGREITRSLFGTARRRR